MVEAVAVLPRAVMVYARPGENEICARVNTFVADPEVRVDKS